MICHKCLQQIKKNTLAQHGLHADCFYHWFELSDPTDFINLIAKKATSLPNYDDSVLSNIKSSFFHGRFKKYAATLDEKKYILKVEEKDYPELPATEYLCNQIAYYLKLPIPPFYYLKLHNQFNTFVTRNFITENKPSNLIHIYHYFTKDQDFNCENLINILQDKTQRFRDIRLFIELCLFDALIGNHDRHGRNLALIQTVKGFHLAPFYDNPSYLGIEDEKLLPAQHDPRGKIATAFTDEPKMEDYVVEFNRLGYQDIVANFYKKVDLNKLLSIIQQSFVSMARKEAITRLITRRYEELKNGYIK